MENELINFIEKTIKDAIAQMDDYIKNPINMRRFICELTDNTKDTHQSGMAAYTLVPIHLINPKPSDPVSFTKFSFVMSTDDLTAAMLEIALEQDKL